MRSKTLPAPVPIEIVDVRRFPQNKTGTMATSPCSFKSAAVPGSPAGSYSKSESSSLKVWIPIGCSATEGICYERAIIRPAGATQRGFKMVPSIQSKCT